MFMEEFIKKHTGHKSRDDVAFRELSETDKESVNEMLKGFGIQYKEAFWVSLDIWLKTYLIIYIIIESRIKSYTWKKWSTGRSI